MVPEGNMPAQDQLGLIQQSRAAKMAQENVFECAKCKRILKADDGIIAVFRGNILVGLCMDCFDERPIIMRVVQTGEGEAVEVRILSELEATALKDTRGLIAPPTPTAVRAISEGRPMPPIPTSRPKVKTIFSDEDG